MRPFRLVVLLLASVACSDSNDLPDASITNVERSETLYALVGTPVATPSGYSLEGSRRIRTDLTVEFDFAYNLQGDGSHVFVPRAALGIDSTAAVKPGFLRRSESFDAITMAASNWYITDQVIPITVGDRFMVRSRITCVIGVPKYAKVEVLGFDDAARTVAFRILTDDNCGFKGLQPGLPDS